MDKNLEDLFQQEREEIEKKKEERKIPVSERREIKKQKEIRKMISSIPDNRREFTTFITKTIISSYIMNRENDLNALNDPHPDMTEFYQEFFYRAADVEKVIKVPECNNVLAALSYCTKSQIDKLYYNSKCDKLLTLNKAFFEKHGISVKHKACYKHGNVKDELIISFTKKQAEDFIKYVIDNYKNQQISLTKDYIDEINSTISRLDKEEEIINSFINNQKRTNDLALLDICKGLIDTYKKLPYDDDSASIAIYPKFRRYHSDMCRLTKSEEEVLDKNNYLKQSYSYTSSKGEELLVSIPYLESVLKEFGVHYIDADNIRGEIRANVETFVKAALSANASDTKKK